MPFLKDHEIKKSAHRAKGGQPTEPGLQSIAEPPEDKKNEMIKTLEDMGSSKEQAVALLKRTGWNIEFAASAFFEMMNAQK